jgi:hypothetical protein
MDIEHDNSSKFTTNDFTPDVVSALEISDERAERELQQFIDNYIQCVNAGVCPECEAKVEFEQKGIHVVGSCGHRLFIGTSRRLQRKRRSNQARAVAVRR